MTDLDEVDLLDAGVGVAPVPADERDSGVGLEVDDRVGQPGSSSGGPGMDAAESVRVRV